MRVIGTITELKDIIIVMKKEGRTIGFVPTMGYLHEGHISLVNMSRQDNDITIISIFVNPSQFGPNEDFEKYPRDIEGDTKKAGEAGADILFIPSAKEMYPEKYNTYVEVYGITDKLCGRSRPGHFKGVCTIVLKLLNIVEPDNAYFGQKDAQQVAVVKRMVKDLNSTVRIVVCPIIREEDGLAMSSRNVYLSQEERKAAQILSRSLYNALEMVNGGERNAEKITNYIIARISSEKLACIDYAEVLDAETLDFKETLEGTVLMAVAVKFGNTRLIDNVITEVKQDVDYFNEIKNSQSQGNRCQS